MTTSIPHLLSAQFVPTSPADFCGDLAQRIARTMDALVARNRPTGHPIRCLLKGEPGTGKSMLAKYLTHKLGDSPFSLHKYNGTDLNVEMVRELRRTIAYRTLDGSWHRIWVDEADKIPSAAQVAILTLMDDLPPHSAVVVTSNADLGALEQRFHSRGYCVHVDGPTLDEVREFLLRFTTDQTLARSIAEASCGAGEQQCLSLARANVRSALNDLDLALLSQAA